MEIIWFINNEYCKSSFFCNFCKFTSESWRLEKVVGNFLESAFRLKGTDKIHTEGFSKFIPRNCLNSTLMYILFSLDVIHMAKLAMWPREGTPGRHEPPLWETSLFYAEMSMRNTSKCVCQFVQYRKVFFYLCFKFK